MFNFWEEHANVEKLQQDHPCVLHLIKKLYLRQPTPRNQSYLLNNGALADPSDGQSKGILRILRNQVNKKELSKNICRKKFPYIKY